MPQAQLTTSLTLEYDTFGDAGNPAILLIMGLGTQMIAWHPVLCQQLADEGFYVIRFDNRDAGLSSELDFDWPSIEWSFIRSKLGFKVKSPYLLADMAADAMDLLGSLGIEAAHLVGVSMGGMIAQEAAIRYPDRVLSLASIMSTTSSSKVGQAEPFAVKLFRQKRPEGRDAVIDSIVSARRLLAGGYFDEAGIREFATNSYDRSYRPEVSSKHLIAVVASADRTEALRRLSVPALVIHGRKDPLINFDGGEATAAAIPGAIFVAFDEMGHDLPHELWSEYVKHIAGHAKAATQTQDQSQSQS
jgi:pimeloyl-ACP methyl ester carboxylesterase